MMDEANNANTRQVGIWDNTTLRFTSQSTANLSRAAAPWGWGHFTSFIWPLPQAQRHAHWARLLHDSAALNLTLPAMQPEHFWQALADWLPQNTASDASRWRVRLCSTAQAQRWQDTQHPAPAVLTAESEPFTPCNAVKPLRLLATAYSKPLPHIKHLGLTEAILHRQHAIVQGFDDALWVNPEGIITETTNANVIFKTSRGYHTAHPLRDGCLPGTQRARVIEELTAMGQTVDETGLPSELLRRAPETLLGAWALNAVQGVVPIAAIGEHVLPVGPIF